MCGCHSGPKGGLARRAAYQDTLKARLGSFLQLDLGDFSSLQDLTAEYETRFVWRMMERLKVSAAALGPNELTNWAIVRELTSKKTIPVVCSNVTGSAGGAIADPFLILEDKGVRVALIALMGRDEFESVPRQTRDQFAFTDPFEKARRLVPDLHAKADLVVLMSQMSTAVTDSLLKSVPGVDAALYGHDAEYEATEGHVGSTIVNRTGVRGQYLGRLTLTVDPAGKIVRSSSDNMALGQIMPEDAGLATEVKDALAKVKQIREEERARRQAEFERKMSGG